LWQVKFYINFFFFVRDDMSKENLHFDEQSEQLIFLFFVSIFSKNKFSVSIEF